MSLYDSLMESVIYEDSVEEYKERIMLDESKIEDAVEKMLDKFYNLSHYKLTRDDLTNTAKVKDAIKNMNLESNRNAKKRALPILITTLITFITGISLSTLYSNKEFENYGKANRASMDAFRNADFEDKFDASHKAFEESRDNFNKDNKALLAASSVCLIIAAGAYIASGFALINDYDRLIMACDRSVKKLRKELDKEKRKSDPDKGRIKNIEIAIDKINETQNMVIRKKKDEMSTTVRNI